MVEPDVNATLCRLRQSAMQIRDFLAWEQLKQSEQRLDTPPAFQLYDPTASQLRNAFSFFVARAVDLHAVLNDPSPRISKAALESVRRQLARIETEVHALGLEQKFWRL